MFSPNWLSNTSWQSPVITALRPLFTRWIVTSKSVSSLLISQYCLRPYSSGSSMSSAWREPLFKPLRKLSYANDPYWTPEYLQTLDTFPSTHSYTSVGRCSLAAKDFCLPPLDTSYHDGTKQKLHEDSIIAGSTNARIELSHPGLLRGEMTRSPVVNGVDSTRIYGQATAYSHQGLQLLPH